MEPFHCRIEQHAVLYGLLARAATAHGPAGREALISVTVEYGLERGRRMARYAAQEGIVPRGENYSLFKEWRSLPGQMCPGESVGEPSFTTTVTRCEWVESWKKYGLLEFGRTYCQYIDRKLYEGFQESCPTRRTLTVRSTLSAGDPVCRFDWGYARTPALAAWSAENQRELGDRYVRDFDFHTGDLLRVAWRVFQEKLGEEGRTICLTAWEEFGRMFGEECRKAVRAAAEEQGRRPDRNPPLG